MSNLRRQAADGLASVIDSFVNLKEATQVLDANPSEVADYPRTAVTFEQFSPVFQDEEELLVDQSGEIFGGARATLLTQSNLDVIAGPAKIDSTHRLSKIGSFRGFGRIWAGCRYVGAREEVEHEIMSVFAQEDGVIGRLLVDINTPRIGKFDLPWKWTAVFFMKDQSWSREHSFDERLWSWTNFDVEIDMLIVRSSPLVKNFILELNAHFSPPGESKLVTL